MLFYESGENNAKTRNTASNRNTANNRNDFWQYWAVRIVETDLNWGNPYVACHSHHVLKIFTKLAFRGCWILFE